MDDVRMIRSRRRFPRYVGIFIAVLLLWAIIIHPFLAGLLFGPIEHRGIELYENGKYLDYEHGELFSQFIATQKYVDKCKTVDFYYYDNCWKDTLLEGKIGDFYILELDAGDNYDDIRKDTEQIAVWDFDYDDYWAVEIKPSKEEWINKNRFLIMFGNDQTTIRCLCYAGDKSNLQSAIITLIARDCGLNWKIKT